MFSRQAIRVRGIVCMCLTAFECCAALLIMLGLGIVDHRRACDARESLRQPDPPAGKRPYNVIFMICDQESYHVRGGKDFVLPARQALQRRGVTFRNHYIGSAVCTPSRALFFTGQTPQVNGVYDHLAYGFVPSLSTERPSMGGIMKGLGYKTAYFGKYELSTKVLAAKRTD